MSPSRAAVIYSVATFLACAGVIAIIGGGPELWAGVATAWTIQCLAFWRLNEALGVGRDATKGWIGGMVGRAGGLAVCAGFALAGVTSNDLPLAYGVAIVVLLLAEAAWLARTIFRTASIQNKNFDRTHETG